MDVIDVEGKGRGPVEDLGAVAGEDADERVRGRPERLDGRALDRSAVAAKGAVTPVGAAADVDAFERTAREFIAREDVEARWLRLRIRPL